MRLTKRRLFAAGLALTLMLAVLLWLYQGRDAGWIGLLLLLVAYFTGVMAFLFSLLYSLWAFAIALPVLSWVYGLFASLLVLTERVLFGKMLGAVLNGIPPLKRLEMRLRNSQFRKKLDAVLKKAGLRAPSKMAFITVVECSSCRKEMPADGRVCPYCGVKAGKPKT